ncbi:MAG: hypothetical protein JNK19_11845 [Tabrizicola sp.]|nr:hypothetical protein [Tabrizicola sp.]
MRLLALIAFAFLAACAVKEEAAPEPVMAEPVEVGCPSGDDDGIGGTGCKLD